MGQQGCSPATHLRYTCTALQQPSARCLQHEALIASAQVHGVSSLLRPLVGAVDIEGAEGMVFMPGADMSWIQQARLVSLEVHDFFHA